MEIKTGVVGFEWWMYWCSPVDLRASGLQGLNWHVRVQFTPLDGFGKYERF